MLWMSRSPDFLLVRVCVCVCGGGGHVLSVVAVGPEQNILSMIQSIADKVCPPPPTVKMFWKANN